MRRPDVGRAREVGDRTGQLEHTVVGACREVQLAHGRLHQPLARAIELAVAAHLGRPHIGVGQQARALETLGLDLPSGRNPLADSMRRLAQPLSAELLVVHAWNIYVDVDAVEQRPRDALLLARYHGGRARAVPLAVPVIAAWARIHCCDSQPEAPCPAKALRILYG
jgi:hypothetical protein